MRSYNLDECETNDLERWENEGGRICKPDSERHSRGREPIDRRKNKDSLQRISFCSVSQQAERRTPAIA
jgi:hypothetical protein